MNGRALVSVVLMGLAVSAGTVLGQTTTYSGANGGNSSDTWNQLSGGTPQYWDNGIPSGAGPWDVIIAPGWRACPTEGYIVPVDGETPTPAYTGNLTLQTNASLEIGKASTDTDLNAMGTGTITMNSGSVLAFRRGANTVHDQDIVLAGDALIEPCLSTDAHQRRRTFNGTISGSGKLSVRGESRNWCIFTGNNAAWSGGLRAYSGWSQVMADGTNCFGTGDVTIDDDMSLQVETPDAIGDGATLHLKARKGQLAGKLVMNGSDTVSLLTVDDFPYPSGTYGAAGTGADYEVDWISGSSLLTVSNAPADSTGPTVTFEGTAFGGSTSNAYVGEPVTYTITFTEPHTPALTSSNLENVTGTAMEIVSFAEAPELGGMTLLSYAVVVKALETGSLDLQIKSGTVIKDLFNNPLTVPVSDEDLITILPQPLIAGELGVWKPWANGGSNPETDAPWAVGDQYRLAFVTTAAHDATNTNIEVYNAFVQGVATGSVTFPKLGNGTWNVIASTADVAARDNTGTNPGDTNHTDVAVLLLDGATLFAAGNTDLWNGSPTRPDLAGISMSPYFNEEGVEETTDHSTYTGSTSVGVQSGDRSLGGDADGAVTTGKVRPTRYDRWMQQYNTAKTNTRRFFALSEPLTLQSAAPKGTILLLR